MQADLLSASNETLSKMLPVVKWTAFEQNLC